jgi:sporulation protein YlmC with PRC-barrel domain
MILRMFSVALLTTTLVGGAAFAQTAQPTTPKTESTVTTAAVPAGQLNMKGAWRTSKLVGLGVYNEANEKLGDINEIILDNTGKVAAVVIGVGGFLGMGEHDIAVPMDKLKFVERAPRTATTTTDRTTAAVPAGTTTTTTTTSTTGTTATTGTTSAPATGTTTAPATTSTTGAVTVARTTNDWAPERAVMNATKDQLKAIPQFRYSDYN